MGPLILLYWLHILTFVGTHLHSWSGDVINSTTNSANILKEIEVKEWFIPYSIITKRIKSGGEYTTKLDKPTRIFFLMSLEFDSRLAHT